MIKIPTSQSNSVAQLSRSSSAGVDVPTSGFARGISQSLRGITSAMSVSELTATAFAKASADEKLLGFKEASATELAELSLLEGNDAKNLSGKYDEWVSKYNEKLEFDTQDERDRYFEAQNVYNSNARTKLNIRAVEAANQYLKKQEKLSRDSAVDGIVAALHTNDMESFKLNLATYGENSSSFTAGLSSDEAPVAVAQMLDGQIAGELVAIGNYNPTSAVVGAQKAFDLGAITEATLETVKLQFGDGYKKSLAKTSVEEIVDMPHHSYQILPNGGLGNKLPFEERMDNIKEAASGGLKLEDPVFGSIDLSDEQESLVNEYINASRKEHNSYIEGLVSEAADANAILVDREASDKDKEAAFLSVAEIKAVLKHEGEDKKVKEIDDMLIKDRDSDVGVYTDVMSKISTGEITNMAQLSDYFRHLNAGDVKELSNFLKDAQKGAVKGDLNVVKDIIGTYTEDMTVLEAKAFEDNVMRSFSAEYSKAKRASEDGNVDTGVLGNIISRSLQIAGAEETASLESGGMKQMTSELVDYYSDTKLTFFEDMIITDDTIRSPVIRAIDAARRKLVAERGGYTYTQQELKDEAMKYIERTETDDIMNENLNEVF